MKSLRLVSVCALWVFGLLATVPAQAGQHGSKLIWSRIVGLADPGSLVGRRESGEDCNVGIDCVQGAVGAWSAAGGSASVDLDSGRVDFSVEGLVVASDPSFANLGTPSVVSMVKGTFVCNDTEPGIPELVDTDPVRLTARGNARFHGHVELPASCTGEPGDIVFLIRIADVSDPDRAFLIDLYNAFGAVRIGPGDSALSESD